MRSWLYVDLYPMKVLWFPPHSKDRFAVIELKMVQYQWITIRYLMNL